MNIIDQLNAEQMTRDVPDFRPGDTVVVQVKVKEGNRERLQAYEGVVIARRNRGLHSSFTVRKLSHGEGVERVFQTYSPQGSTCWLRCCASRRRAARSAGLAALRQLLADARCLALAATQVVQLGPTHATAALDVDVLDLRAVGLEHALDALAGTSSTS